MSKTVRDQALEVIRNLPSVYKDEDVVGALVNAGLLVEPTKRDRVIELIAQVLAGLQVPVSLPNSEMFLGAARQPWVELRQELNMFGWDTDATFAAKLKEVL